MDLAAVARAASHAAFALTDAHARDPLAFMRWTPPQEEWLRLSAPRKLMRGGNQSGKTWVGLAEVIGRATGRHPFQRVRPPPVEIWIVCTSWAQSVAIMQKFWALVPREELRAGTSCDPRNGFGKDNPAVVFKNGSIVRFRTTNQGPEALAGATIDYVHIDEPCDEDVYRELDRRVMRRGGSIGLTLTPINRPTGWLRELVTAGAVKEVHARLTEANLTPRGARGPLRLLDGTPMNAAWIAEQWRITPARYAGVVLDGDWETRPEGVFYACFDPKKHVSDRVRIDPRGGKIQWVLGFDYAAADRDYGHCASLSQIQRRVNDDGKVGWSVYTVDEVVLSGTDSTERAASEVIRMLGRQGLRWSDLDHVHGDNPVASRWVEKSNLQMMRAIAREIGAPYDRLSPRILNAKDNQRSAAAFDAGCRWIYARLAAGEMMIHPRCTRHIEGLQSWDYTRDHPYKDVLDAQRYALKPAIFQAAQSATARLVMR